MSWCKVSNEIDLSTPFIRKVTARGRALCLVNAEGSLYALAAACPHAGADLSKGWCSNGKLVCPFHRYSYDLSTGRGTLGQNDFVNVYPVQVRKDGIYVEINSWMDRVKEMFKS
jgi:nitrite reductase/ring-hydroxylating ferredoxin subunit